MRFMLLLTYDEARATAPEPGEFEAMGAYNTALVDAGVLLAGEGLTPTAQGALVRFGETVGEEPTVSDGPFTEAREVVGGFWILELPSLADAVGWARRAPCGKRSAIQVRRIFEASDFAGVAPDEVMEQEEVLRGRAARQHEQGQQHGGG